MISSASSASRLLLVALFLSPSAGQATCSYSENRARFVGHGTEGRPELLKWRLIERIEQDHWQDMDVVCAGGEACRRRLVIMGVPESPPHPTNALLGRPHHDFASADLFVHRDASILQRRMVLFEARQTRSQGPKTLQRLAPLLTPISKNDEPTAIDHLYPGSLLSLQRGRARIHPPDAGIYSG